MQINNNELLKIADVLYDKNKNATLWDVIVMYLSNKGNIEPCILWILSDLQVLELIARGYSVQDISEELSMSKSSIKSISEVWGMSVPEYTLSYDPLSYYSEATGCLINELPENITNSEKENLEKYIKVKQLLNEWEEKNE